MDPNEELARLRAEMDQGNEAMKEFANTLWVYFAALMEQGFSPQQALQLTLGWQTATMRGLSKGEADE